MMKQEFEQMIGKEVSYGRLELMSDDMRRRFDEFVQKVKVYEKEKETAI